jgi:mannitol-1-/sugar-/sorbitol-6-/2-deoxyglucose-6-phosphatase
MQGQIKVVIFDMDGVLIDSEPYWRKAMIKGFKDVGMNFTEDDCRSTTGMRLREVIAFWFEKWELQHLSITETNVRILDYLIEYIELEGEEMLGVSELLIYLKHKGYKIGLATSSDERFMKTVIKKLNISSYFDAVVSAETLKYAKPHPEVFLKCAEALGAQPQQCFVIEDSLNGVIAAKAASMFVVAIPEELHKTKKGFSIADKQVERMLEIKELL